MTQYTGHYFLSQEILEHVFPVKILFFVGGGVIVAIVKYFEPGEGPIAETKLNGRQFSFD